MSQFDGIPLGWPLPKRKKFLQDLMSTKGGDSQYSINLTFQKRSQIFPVYVVPIALPKYRLENGRTQASQENYLATNPKLPLDFFRQDKESEQAQRIQHKLLYDMLDKNNLMSYFKDTGTKQTEPLILTHEGYVVNGNRRLCAMRMLYLEKKDKYAHFANIDVVILPHCDPQDIDELEAYLQVQQDIKARYTWIAEACMMRARRQDYHYDDKTLAVIYGKTEKEVGAIFQRLGFVDEYLRSIGKERQYEIVEQNEHAFKQIQKVRPQVKDDDLKDLVTQLSYVFVENSGEVTGRLYERIPELKENLNEIAKRLSTELKITKTTKTSKDNYDLFGSSTTRVSPIISAITKPENKQKVVQIALDVIDGEKEKKRQKKKTDSVLNEVSEANTYLQNATNYINEKGVLKTGVLEQITMIENSLKLIKKWLNTNG
jgi:hypothetical protein